MIDIPRIRIELEGIRSTINHAFMNHNSELNEMIIAEVERQLSLEHVQAKITYAVSDCINKSIQDLTNNISLQRAITEMIADNVEKLIKESQ